ncbi:MAG: acyl carrier protein [Lawsonibacter sp.]|jgi:acyl carrier protein|uniref:acyl carrier protein n=1 Tax=Lawsonibacter sp. JLR.KK007 TaxID=3114293 RepID=UPI0021702808|nr:acyl carrier protein [Lawsonibacter sp.]MCI8989276.1 acyl carrier protein [Lawsonibacter sp.]MCI9267811.1 acyl carrier protein [Lawsonibacter sp.]
MIFEKLAALIAEQFNVDADSITMETSFTDDLNADSVDIVDLSMALEEEFGIEELEEEEASSISTVGDLVRFLQNKID